MWSLFIPKPPYMHEDLLGKFPINLLTMPLNIPKGKIIIRCARDDTL